MQSAPRDRVKIETKIPTLSLLTFIYLAQTRQLHRILSQIQLYPLIASLPNTKYKHDRALTLEELCDPRLTSRLTRDMGS